MSHTNHKLYRSDGITFQYIKNDLPAGLVVFLVALPLCLGIALASGAPLFAGLITGMVGGVLVSILSGGQLCVSGPAAGLTVIVFNAIQGIGSYEGFLLAVVLAGIIQLILGLIKAGAVGNYFPSSVIKGMLAAIGIILIIKQVPHAIGYDADYEGDFQFIQPDHENSFSAILSALNKISLGAFLISAVSLVILVIWDKLKIKQLKNVPAPLIVVIVGVVLNLVFEHYFPAFALRDTHLVTIPVAGSLGEFFTFFTLPDFSFISNPEVYRAAFTIGIIASIETLLSIDAVDKLDPLKRNTPPSRELKAQGLGNIVAGLLGGLPMTAVIVRGSANVNAGAKSKASSFFHGIFLLLATLTIPIIINLIPYASLAAILLVTGYKLTKFSLYREMFRVGYDQFLPFIITVGAIVLTDLLIGISIGLGVGIIFILTRNMKQVYSYDKKIQRKDDVIHLVLSEEVSFLNKASILLTLDRLPHGSRVVIDGTHSSYIDYDVLEVIHEFKQNAHHRNIEVELKGIKEIHKVAHH